MKKNSCGVEAPACKYVGVYSERPQDSVAVDKLRLQRKSCLRLYTCGRRLPCQGETVSGSDEQKAVAKAAVSRRRAL